MKQKIIGLVLFGVFMMTQPIQAAFGGFRVGGTFGVQLLQGRHWYTGQTPIAAEYDQVRRLSNTSTMYGGHGGYLIEFGASKIVAGIEAYAIIPQAAPKVDLQLLNRSIEGTVEITHSRSLGLALTVGMMFNPKIMVYANAGMELAKFQFTYLFSDPALLASFDKKQVVNHVFKPIVVGIGAAYKIGPHLLVGFEIASPFFKRFKVRIGTPRSYHYKPVERRAMAKLTYLF